jgi:hypothetical protein
MITGVWALTAVERTTPSRTPIFIEGTTNSSLEENEPIDHREGAVHVNPALSRHLFKIRHFFGLNSP